MPTAKNKRELEKMLMDSLETTMKKVASKSLKELKSTTNDFYHIGKKPKLYQRTDQLKNTPQVSPLTRNETSISFDAELDASGQYSTGSNPTMYQVLQWAEHGEAGITGGPLKWNQAKEKIRKTFREEMQKKYEK